MTETQREPWWAREDPAGMHDDDANGHGSHQRPAWWDAYEAIGRVARDLGGAGPAGGRREAGVDGDGPQDGHVHTGAVDACQICPVCALIRLAGEVRPELVAHLAEAARHLTLAAKTVIDAQAAGWTRDGGLERIVLDDE